MRTATLVLWFHVQYILEQDSGVLAQRPVFDCLGDPDLDTASWFIKRLTKSLKELATAKGVPNTPPPSESGEECTAAGDEAVEKKDYSGKTWR